MKQVTVKTIETEGVVTMYTLSFMENELSEFEKFIQKFKDNLR